MEQNNQLAETHDRREKMMQEVCERFGMSIRGKTIKHGDMTAKVSPRPLAGRNEIPVVIDMQLRGLTVDQADAILAILDRKQ